MTFSTKPYLYLFFFWLICISLLCGSTASKPGDNRSAGNQPRISIFISKSIRPYVEAADSIREVLGESIDAKIDVIKLDHFGEKARISLAERILQESGNDLFAAVGPEAAIYVWNSFTNESLLKVYSIILNPDSVSHLDSDACGISLNIPPQSQVAMIREGLPSVKQIGLFYDPENNSNFHQAADEAASQLGLNIIPLKVKSKKDIPLLLSQSWRKVDCIWLIPDRTVISESVAQYIIKEAILKKVPVVGYNQFFYESGAAMAFVFNYADLGRQTADLVIQLLGQHFCENPIPVFQVWINKAVILRLGMDVPISNVPQVKFGP